MKKQIKVGVTGGIGSGKSFICQILQNMGYPIFFSDQTSKHLLAHSPEIIAKVKSLIGQEAYHENGEVNRPFIASKVFSDESLLEKLNHILHPAVRLAFDEWSQEQDSAIVFNEAAILFETDGYLQLDKNILVIAPKQIKIDRILKRESISEQEIEKRMSNQWTDERKIPLADYIINNNEGAMLVPQINEIIEDIERQLNY